jgi:hypothetical protein
MLQQQVEGAAADRAGRSVGLAQLLQGIERAPVDLPETQLLVAAGLREGRGLEGRLEQVGEELGDGHPGPLQGDHDGPRLAEPALADHPLQGGVHPATLLGAGPVPGPEDGALLLPAGQFAPARLRSGSGRGDGERHG